MTLEEVESTGWRYDPNLGGEEFPNLNNVHGYSSGYEIDNQEIDGHLYLMYHFPDGFTIIEKFVNCGGGSIEDMLFRGFLTSDSNLRLLMFWLKIIK